MPFEMPPKPLPGETGDDYIKRVNFEADDDGQWWCLKCGAHIRGAEWLIKHYESVHTFTGF